MIFILFIFGFGSIAILYGLYNLINIFEKHASSKKELFFFWFLAVVGLIVFICNIYCLLLAMGNIVSDVNEVNIIFFLISSFSLLFYMGFIGCYVQKIKERKFKNSDKNSHINNHVSEEENTDGKY